MLKPLQAILDKILKQKKEEIKEMKKEWVVCSNSDILPAINQRGFWG